jgi:hypothetical protein
MMLMRQLAGHGAAVWLQMGVKLGRGMASDLRFATVRRPIRGQRSCRVTGRASEARASASTARCHSRRRNSASVSIVYQLLMIDSSFSWASVALRASRVPTLATSIERGRVRFVRSQVVGDMVLYEIRVITMGILEGALAATNGSGCAL